MKEREDYNTLGITEFEKVLNEIFYLAFEYGVKSVGPVLPDKDGKEKYKQFIGACHEGYSLAQKKIVDNLLDIEDRIKTDRKQLKILRRERKK